ncbi:hypothetical protein V1511DRAFT_512602 [Dipodascopsis uninucleata]
MRCDTCLTDMPELRTAPATPPAESAPSAILATALTILRSQTMAISHLTDMYLKDSFTQNHYVSAVQLIHNALLSGGKVVISGMGKSGLIANKIVASMNSLGIHATALHPCDALHGDLGVLRPADVLIMITASGKTPELIQLIPHLPGGLPRICLTCTPNSELANDSNAVLSADLPKSLNEKEIYGVPAPTTSTTACLAIGDALCISLAEMLTADQEQRRKAFIKSHPGGAIGMPEQQLSDVMTPWTDIAFIDADADEIEILRAAAGRQWVCIGDSKLYEGSELANPHFKSKGGVSVDRLRRMKATDKVGSVKPGEIVAVIGDMNKVIGIFQA